MPTGYLPSAPGAGRRRRTHPAVTQRSGVRRRCRPYAGAVCRPDHARRHNSLVVNLAGSGQVQPTYWLNRENGVSYKHRPADAAVWRRDRYPALPNLPIGRSCRSLLATHRAMSCVRPALVSGYAAVQDLQSAAASRWRASSDPRADDVVGNAVLAVQPVSRLDCPLPARLRPANW